MQVTVRLTGQDSNIFNLVGIASREMKRAGLHDKAKEMTNKVFASSSFDDAMNIIGKYCNVQ